jgi:hypothetical protein
MHARQVIKAIFPLLTALFLSCVPEREKAVTLQGIQQFHNRYNNSQFSEIYDSAQQNTRDKISKSDFVEDMKAMRQGQGAVLKSEEISSEYRYSDGVAMIKTVVLVSFEKGTAREEFIFYHSNGDAHLASYRFLGP